MNYMHAVVYGLVQGLTEYLPVSSSAHLILLPRVLGIEDPGLAFDVFLHLGTLFATFIYFRHDWVGILCSLPTMGRRLVCTTRPPSEAGRTSWQAIVIATAPIVLAGLVVHGWVAGELRALAVIAWTLPLGGLALIAIDYGCSRTRGMDELGGKDALWVGLAQCLALVPGVSRSGATIAGGRLLGFDRETAARFSFLISAPAILLAVIFKLRHWRELTDAAIGLGPLLVAGLSSFVFGCLAISALMHLVKRHGLLPFAIYRILAGIGIWIFVAA